jgi:hypothetical protein
MARAVRNTNSDAGTRVRMSAMHPSAKAMSVAIGMPQPGCASVPRATAW